MNEPKRVLVIVGNMNRGGAETMVMNLFRSLDKKTISFDFLYFTNKESDYDKEILSLDGRIYSVEPTSNKLKILNPIIRAFNLYKHLRSERGYLAVHSHTLYSTGFHLLVAKLAGVKNRIAHSHNTSNKKKSRLGSLYKIVATILINTFATKKIACGIEAGHFLFGKSFDNGGLVLPNAVDFDAYTKDKITCKQLLCKELGLLDNTIIVGQVGSLTHTKNHKFSLNLLKHLLSEGLNVHFVFAGVGPLKDELVDFSNQLGISRNVSFLGLRTDIPELVNAMDIFLMPSFHEGLPVSIIEAQAAGTKCVVSDKITKETDLRLDLMQFVALESSFDKWQEAIFESTKLYTSNIEDRRRVFKETKYDINESKEVLMEVYKF